jgi:hypothetical protein
LIFGKALRLQQHQNLGSWRKEMKNTGQKVVLSYFAAAAALALSLYAVFIGGTAQPVSAQTDAYLSRRIDQVEQRFYMLESRLNRIETSSRPAATLPSTGLTVNAVELQFLRTQTDALRTRVGELECAVLKLDERTLAAAAKSVRRSSADPEPCRLSSGTPVSLSARP